MIGRRVTFQDHFGTVRYEGPILHEDRGSDVWLGVEWDDVSRGRHNGVVAGQVYFQTQNNAPSGSLLKADKVSSGVNILDAIFLKYFKEIPDNLHGILDENIIKELQEHQPTDSVVHANLQKVEEGKIQEDPHSKYATVAGGKQVLVEFDNNAYFETGKHKKKMVEFYGFNEIWEKINNLKKLKDLSINQLYISSVGKFGFLKTILPNLRILSLESNLLYSWHQVFIVGKQLPLLKELSLSNQVFRPLETQDYIKSLLKIESLAQVDDTNQTPPIDPEESKEQIPATKLLQEKDYFVVCLESSTQLDFNPIGLFKNLRVLVLINNQLNWKILSQILPAFLEIEELVLCKNTLTDYDNLVLQGQELAKLKVLNLEDTKNDNFEAIQKAFGHLPELQSLILNRNGLKKLCKLEGFKNVNSVSMEYNLLADAEFMSQLSGLKKLIRLNVRNNPLQDRLGRNYVRQRAIAEIGTLEWMNCSNLNKYERKDSEIFYLKSAFESYFLLMQVPHYFYDFEDFMAYAKTSHPRIPYLLQKFGNPYEIDITVKGDVKTAFKQAAPKVQYFNVRIVALSGKMANKDPIMKKFQGATGIFPVKQVVSKLVGIALKSVQVSIQVDDSSPVVCMNEKDRTLESYGAMENSLIIVEEVVQ